MNPATAAAWMSWRLDLPLLVAIAAAAGLYLRGWWRLRRSAPARFGPPQLIAYLAGLASLYVALGSPLDAFAGLLLQAHMAQHLILTMVVPPLLLRGAPYLPMLAGLPRPLARDVLGPLLTWPWLRGFAARLVHPLAALPIYVGITFFWHLPAMYELALRQPTWHRVEHFCFLGSAILFWWPLVLPFPSRPWVARGWLVLYLIFADFANTLLAAFLCFSGKVLYPIYAASVLPETDPLTDQAAAGAMMWALGSFAYLIPAAVITVKSLSTSRAVRPSDLLKAEEAARARTAGTLIAKNAKIVPLAAAPVRVAVPRPLGSLRLARFRPWVQATVLVMVLGVIIDGLFGPPLAPSNLAGVLPWIFWRGLVVIGLLLVGNAACYACPVTFVRDLWRRILPARWSWPARLRGKWGVVALILLFLWSYETFRLWESPRLTAWLLIGYFAVALVVDGLFKGATFCQYLCPMGHFQTVQSLASPAQVAVRSADVCAGCTTHDCLRGNEAKRGCELHLFQPSKSGSLDCTFCLDCVSACPHENVAWQPAWPAVDLTREAPRSVLGAWEQRPDVAALVVVLAAGAFVNAALMVEPVQQALRPVALALALSPAMMIGLVVLVGAVALPALLVAIATAASHGLAGRSVNAAGAKTFLARASRSAMALAPIGASMWSAHFLFHFVTGVGSLPMLADRFFAAGQAPAAGSAFLLEAARWLPTVEVLLLDAGLLLSVFAAWKIASAAAPTGRRALASCAPWALLIVALYLVGAWITFQPMDMRGTVWMLSPP